MSKREQMILLAYKVALTTIDSYTHKNSDKNTINFINGIIQELDATILNIKTKIDIEV